MSIQSQKLFQKSQFENLNFSQITFREISCLTRTTPLVSQVHAMCQEPVNLSSNCTIWFAAVPAHEAYIAHKAHPVLCTHFGFKEGIRAVSCPYPMPILH